MNSPTITMERAVAAAKLCEYEDAVRANPKRATDMDRGIAKGYRILARGGRLVDVNEALKAGGLNLAGQPKLAISRADALSVRWRAENNRLRYFWHDRAGDAWSTRHQGDKFCWIPPLSTFDPEKTVKGKLFRAMAPLVPLPLRPKHHLSNYFLLWEANWHPEPPRDPYLLRPLAGSLMEIVAEWDLTPLEIAAVKNAAPR